MDLKLTGKLALVSGSTAGIGYAIAESLAHEGAHVIINGRSTTAVEAAIAKLGETCKTSLSGFAGDLSKAEEAHRLAREYADVEILVNNLGIYEPKSFDEITDDDWRRLFEIMRGRVMAV